MQETDWTLFNKRHIHIYLSRAKKYCELGRTMLTKILDEMS